MRGGEELSHLLPATTTTITSHRLSVHRPQPLGPGHRYRGVKVTYTRALDTWKGLQVSVPMLKEALCQIANKKQHDRSGERQRKKGKRFFLLFEETLWGFCPGSWV